MIAIIKKFEGLSLKAYKDIVGVWTIGYGNTFYENGNSVKEGDQITLERAEALLAKTVEGFKDRIEPYITSSLNENQWAAILSLAYNIGVGAFKSSTLLKKINIDPNDPGIREQFLRWNRAGGKVVLGLTRRRTKEADLYEKPEV
jgi:lysozyme